MVQKIVRLNVETIPVGDGEAHSHCHIVFIDNGKTYATGVPRCIFEGVESHYYEMERAIGNVEEYALETGMKFELAKVGN